MVQTTSYDKIVFRELETSRQIIDKATGFEISWVFDIRIMKKIIIVLLITYCENLQTQSIKVAAAANLRLVFEKVDAAYEKANPGVTVEANYGSSGMLLQQILNGADFDVFMAADYIFPEKLKDQGAAVGEMKIYALGKLVLWSNSIDVSQGLNVLTSPSVTRIAIAKPELAPYGDRAIECLKNAGIYELVQSKIVYADNISQTAQFIQTANAEVGFLSMSLTLSPKMKGSTYEINQSTYKPIEQGVILVKNWKAKPEAAKFMKFLLSQEGKPIFEQYGYSLPK